MIANHLTLKTSLWEVLSRDPTLQEGIRFLDDRMHQQHYEFPGVKELPSTYFHRQIAVTFVHEPEGVEDRHAIGIDNLLWSTDFPPPLCNWPSAAEKPWHLEW